MDFERQDWRRAERDGPVLLDYGNRDELTAHECAPRDAACDDRVDAVLAAPPFTGLVRLDRLEVSSEGGTPGAVVAIPVRDEQDLLPASLQALSHALSRADESCGVVLLVNNSSDRSWNIARAWAGTQSSPTLVADVRLAPAIAHAGHARRLALDLADMLARPESVLLTTDADTLVSPHWFVGTRDAVSAGADLVCGAVDVPDAEVARLPEPVRRCGVVEWMLYDRLERLWRMILPDAGRPFMLRASGATLGIRASTYRSVGRLPAVACGEDAALARAVFGAGGRIDFDAGVRVTTSCRMDGRATAGMADALADRARSHDPVLDPALVPVAAFLRRVQLWRMLEREDRSGVRSFGLRWPEGRSPTLAYETCVVKGFGLTAPRMTLSDAVREISVANRLLRRLGIDDPHQIGPAPCAC